MTIQDLNFENKIFCANPEQKTITIFLRKRLILLQKTAIYKFKIKFNPEKFRKIQNTIF